MKMNFLISLMINSLYEDIFADVTFLNIMLSYNVYYYQDLAEELGTEQDIIMWPMLLITQTLFWR